MLTSYTRPSPISVGDAHDAHQSSCAQIEIVGDACYYRIQLTHDSKGLGLKLVGSLFKKIHALTTKYLSKTRMRSGLAVLVHEEHDVSFAIKFEC